MIMFKNGITAKRTAAGMASAVALFAAAGILTATIAAAPASATSQMTRFWSGDLTKRHSVEMTVFKPAGTRAAVTGSQLTRYWSGQLTDRRQLRQNLALAESLAIHTGVTPTIEARAVESGPDFWGDTKARR
jgi:hypothetical protein